MTTQGKDPVGSEKDAADQGYSVRQFGRNAYV